MCGRGRCKTRCMLGGAVAAVALVALVATRIWWRKPVGHVDDTTFSTERAVRFAKVAGASYCSPEDLQHWSCGLKCIEGVSSVDVCPGDTSKAFVALWDQQCVVSFMGTQNYLAMLRDLEAYETSVTGANCSGCMVHSGFMREWTGLRDCVFRYLDAKGCTSGSSVRVTGHSMGGAVAALAMGDFVDRGLIIQEAYTFGMPRVGNQQFADHCNQRFSKIFHRVTHHKDPVVHVPLEGSHFRHLQPEYFYDGNNSGGYVECLVEDDENCSAQYWDVVGDTAWLVNHLIYMDIPIGSSGCPGMGAEATAAEAPGRPSPAWRPMPLARNASPRTEAIATWAFTGPSMVGGPAPNTSAGATARSVPPRGPAFDSRVDAGMPVTRTPGGPSPTPGPGAALGVPPAVGLVV